MELYEYARPGLFAGKKILYVHGFASSGASGTVGRIRLLLPQAAEMTCKGLFSPTFTHTRPHFPKLYSVNILYRDRHPDGSTLNK